MAEISQYKFSLEEIAKALLREQGINLGRWALGFEFTITIGNLGEGVADVAPGAILRVVNANLQRMDNAPENAPLVFDAAKLSAPAPRRQGRSK